jgi:hypothetical protein
MSASHSPASGSTTLDPNAEAEITEGLPPGFGNGAMGRVAFWLAVVFSLFQL